MTEIIGDRGKRRRYDPDLAKKLNEEVERKKEKERELESKIEEEKAEEEKIKREETKDAFKRGVEIQFPELEEIIEKYEDFMKNQYVFDELVQKTSSLNATNSAIENFNNFLEKCIDFYGTDTEARIATGLFLSALILSGEEDVQYVLDLRGLNKPGIGIVLPGICSGLEDKKVMIRGNVGDELGYRAKNSEIILRGNCGRGVGHNSKNCRIYVKGDIGGLSKRIREGTQIFHYQDGKYELVYPEK